MLESSGARFAIWVVFGGGFWLEWSLAETYGLGETHFLGSLGVQEDSSPILLIFGLADLRFVCLGCAATMYGSLGQIWYGSLSLCRGLVALVSSPCDSRF